MAQKIIVLKARASKFAMSQLKVENGKSSICTKCFDTDAESIRAYADAFKFAVGTFKEGDSCLVYVPDNMVQRINEGRKHMNMCLSGNESPEDALKAVAKSWMTQKQKEACGDIMDTWMNIPESTQIRVLSYTESYGNLVTAHDFGLDPIKATKDNVLDINGMHAGVNTGIKLNFEDGYEPNFDFQMNGSMWNGEYELYARFSGNGQYARSVYFIPKKLTDNAGQLNNAGRLVTAIWGSAEFKGLHERCSEVLPSNMMADAREAVEADEF